MAPLSSRWRRSRAAPGRSDPPAPSRLAGLTARRAVRSGALWGFIFGIAVASSDVSYTTIYKTQAQRDALAAAYGSNKATSALFGPGATAPDGGRLHRLQDLHDPDGPRRGVGAPDQHPAAPGRGGQRPLGAAAHRPDHPPGRHRPGSRRPRRRRRHAVESPRSSPSSPGGTRRWTSGPVRRSTWPSPWWRAAVMFLGVGALTSQLAATRRQAASYAAVVLGVATPCGWSPTPVSACTG